MEDAHFARLLFATSLAFHIVFAMIGMAMPLLMVLAEVKHRRTGDPQWLGLAKLWGKGTAVLFAIGAVSGTVLSFELGLLFPRFMAQAGALIGIPFSLEGFAFFTEAIFLGIYLYGRDRVSPRLHLFSGVVVAVSGAASSLFVTLVNAWMNTPPPGTRFEGDVLVGGSTFDALWTTAAPHEVLHMLAAGYVSTALAVAAVHAALLLKLRRGPGTPPSEILDRHRKAFGLSLALAVPFALAQPLIGHHAAQVVAEHQPMKLAAMEGHFETGPRAPLSIGGWPDYEAEIMRWGLEIPGGLSFLAFNDPDAVVKGLREIPKADWPHPVVHVCFQIMVMTGGAMALLAVLAISLARSRGLERTWFLRLVVLCGPLGFIATEAGWVTTEVGRQPWVVYGLIRTHDTVTTMPGLHVPFVLFTALYLALAWAVVMLMRAYFRRSLEK